MLYLYRNKYSREKFYFDSIRLKAYRIDDERMKTCKIIDMERRNIVTPYEKYGLVTNSESLMVITRRKMIALWYNWYAYEFTYEDGVYLNDIVLSGIYDIQYRGLPIEYLFIDSKDVVRIGVGMKSGGIKIYPNGICRHLDERYEGEYVSKIGFKTRY